MRYKFRYYNGSMKLLSAFIMPFNNFFLISVFVFLVYFLIGRLAGLFGMADYIFSMKVWIIVRLIIFICASVYAMVYTFSKKGIFLFDNGFEIAKYTITPFSWKNRMFVTFDEIESINVNYYSIRFTRYRYHMLLPTGDYYYNIELTLKNGRKYFFSIEDQEEFVEEVTKRMGIPKENGECSD